MTCPIKTLTYTNMYSTHTQKDIKKNPLYTLLKCFFVDLSTLTSSPRFLTAVLLESWWNSHHRSVLKVCKSDPEPRPALPRLSTKVKRAKRRHGLPLDSLYHQNHISIQIPKCSLDSHSFHLIQTHCAIIFYTNIPTSIKRTHLMTDFMLIRTQNLANTRT